MKAVTVQSQILPILPGVWDATSWVDWHFRHTHLLSESVKLFEQHGREAMKKIGFHWRTKRMARDGFFDFSANVTWEHREWTPYLIFHKPSRRQLITFQPGQWTYFRFLAFQYLLHEFVHLGQMRRQRDAKGRKYGLKDSKALKLSKKDLKDRLYFSQADEIEAYAATLALDWIVRYPEHRRWSAFVRHWKRYDVDNPLSLFTPLDWYHEHFGTDWNARPVLRQLRRKIIFFERLFRPLPFLSEIVL